MTDKNSTLKIGAAAGVAGLLLGVGGAALLDDDPQQVNVPSIEDIQAAIKEANAGNAEALAQLGNKIEDLRGLVIDNKVPLEDAAAAVLDFELDAKDFRDFLNDEGYDVDKDSDLNFQLRNIDVDFSDYNDDDFTGTAKYRVTFEDDNSGETLRKTVYVEFDIDDGDLEDADFSFDN